MLAGLFSLDIRTILTDPLLSSHVTTGYTEDIWDNDGTAPSEAKDWDELSAAEMAAAKVLGYDEASWDA
jgi:hypothetical protein